MCSSVLLETVLWVPGSRVLEGRGFRLGAHPDGERLGLPQLLDPSPWPRSVPAFEVLPHLLLNWKGVKDPQCTCWADQHVPPKLYSSYPGSGPVSSRVSLEKSLWRRGAEMPTWRTDVLPGEVGSPCASQVPSAPCMIHPGRRTRKVHAACSRCPWAGLAGSPPSASLGFLLYRVCGAAWAVSVAPTFSLFPHSSNPTVAFLMPFSCLVTGRK